MPNQLHSISVGPWPMNAYVIVCSDTRKSVIIDPGADSKAIVSFVSDTDVGAILVTHTHGDHVGALNEVRRITGAPVYIHPMETEQAKFDPDFDLFDSMMIQVGSLSILATHTPGHTPGMTSFSWGTDEIVVGDTIFVGGPGRTWSPVDFQTTMRTMQNIVFKWPDKTRFYPGHGPSGLIGEERPAFEKFLSRGWLPGLHGDVTWE